jgi:hypothetical protein
MDSRDLRKVNQILVLLAKTSVGSAAVFVKLLCFLMGTQTRRHFREQHHAKV